VSEPGQVVSTQSGGPPGSPSSPWSRHLSLHRRAPLGPRRGSPAQRGAPLPRDADAALLVGRRRPQPAPAAGAALATRMARPLPRAQTRVRRVLDGCAGSGFHGVPRQRPRRGQHTLALGPAQSAHQPRRHRLQALTSRRAASPPQAGGAMGKPLLTGGAHSGRQTNASQAFRGLQRFGPRRLRRSLTPRRPGRGCGWTRVPQSQLEARGRADRGSGLLTYQANPAPEVRGRRSDRRTRANGPYGGMGRGW
jgi:hypothetical protein